MHYTKAAGAVMLPTAVPHGVATAGKLLAAIAEPEGSRLADISVFPVVRLTQPNMPEASSELSTFALG